MRPIAFFRSPFTEKFGIPRQSSIVPDTRGEIVFLEEFSSPEAFRSLERFSHLWILWGFHKAYGRKWHSTVRPPKMGGNRRAGIFATRSPFRPNPIGLSSVKLGSVSHEGGIASVSVFGADIMDGSPVYDIKPYLPLSDCRPDAVGSLTDGESPKPLEVVFPDEFLQEFDLGDAAALLASLREDPRPAYHGDQGRIYGMAFAGKNVSFSVKEGILRVVSVSSCQNP